jgi:hypothetical protein
MRGNIPPFPQYVFLAWCLVEHRDKFTFTFKVDEVTGLKKTHNGQHRNLYSSPNIVRNARMCPKVSGLAAWSENCKWYSPLLLSAVVSLFCESV